MWIIYHLRFYVRPPWLSSVMIHPSRMPLEAHEGIRSKGLSKFRILRKCWFPMTATNGTASNTLLSSATESATHPTLSLSLPVNTPKSLLSPLRANSNNSHAYNRVVNRGLPYIKGLFIRFSKTRIITSGRIGIDTSIVRTRGRNTGKDWSSRRARRIWPGTMLMR
jgi:hypothetical protein